MTGFFDVFNWRDVAHVDSIASDARKMNRLWQQERESGFRYIVLLGTIVGGIPKVAHETKNLPG